MLRSLTHRILLASLVSLLLALFSAPSAIALDPSRALTQYIHQSYDTNDGLPQDSVNEIVQTPDGYLWLATQEGIARFNGFDFVVFDSRSTGGIIGNFVYALHVDEKGTLWAGSSNGIVRYDGSGRFTRFGEEAGWPAAAKYISGDRAGNLWVGLAPSNPGGVSGKGLIQSRNGRPRAFTTRDGLSNDHVFETAVSPDGKVWFGTVNGLNVFDGRTVRTWRTTDGLPHPIVRSVVIGRHGVWAGTDAGLALLSEGTFVTYTTREGLPDDRILSLFEDSDGILWIGTEKGLARRLPNGHIESAAKIPALAEDRIFDVFEDRERNLWVGTHAGGLHRFRDGLFAPFGKSEGLLGDSVYAINQQADGAMWIASRPGGISKVHPDGAVQPVKAASIIDDPSALCPGRDGSIWIGSRSGLHRLLNDQLVRYDFDSGDPLEDIKVIHEDRSGTIWVGLETGLARGDARGFVRVILPDSAPMSIRTIHEDRAGRLWIGGGDGLGFFRGTAYTPIIAARLEDANVYASLEDADGTLWFTTWGVGLYRIRGEAVTRFTSRDGLYDDASWAILDDGAGNFWLSSNRGIFKVSKRQLTELAEGKRNTVESVVYGTADGMRKREGNAGGPGGFRSRDGRLWFATTGGAVVVDPKRVRENKLPPPVVIEHFIANEEPVLDARPELAPGTRSIEIQYAALSLAAPERVRYRYKLEGFDDHWIEAGTRRKAFYTNIDPGRYRFRVIAANNEGVWNEEGASIEFHLRPFFRQTPTFILLLAGIAALTVFAVRILRRRARRIRHQLYHDPLTGLPNRMLLADRARVAMIQAARSQRSIAVLFLDLDGFKQVNDQLGHAAGDRLLQMVATRFRGCIREIDTLARIGGDEFALLIASLDDETRAAEMATRLIEVIDEPFLFEGQRIKLGVSIGIALHPFDGTDIKSILEAADRAMYRAKLSGGNTYQFNAADRDEVVTM